MNRPLTFRAGRGNPCPCCGAESKGCSATDDGLHLCRGEARPGWFKVKESGGFGCYRPDRKPENRHDRVYQRPRAVMGSDLKVRYNRSRASLSTDLKERHALAILPGLDPAVLDALGCGHEFPGWLTVPLRDASGALVGIGRRSQDGTKKAVKDSRLALIIPNGFREMAGTVYAVEGLTDTAAAVACGLRVVGRPSNMAGAELLADLIASLPDNPSVVVVGDSDQKHDGKCPGREGAERTAAVVAAKIGRLVRVAFPPDGYKDVREWVADQVAGSAVCIDWVGFGRELAEHLTTTTELEAAPTDERWTDFRLDPIDVADLPARVKIPEFAVRRLLVRDQPCILGGPRKALKTSLLGDLVVSLGTGTKFLGEFDVDKPARTLMLSGESGDWAVNQIIERVLNARGIDREVARGMVAFGFQLPQLTNQEHLTRLRERLAADRYEFVVVDPLYLCLLAGAGGDGPSPTNLFEMGPLYASVAQCCLSAGATPILAHHFKLTRADPHAEPELGDLAFAGVQEFARQWLLLSRREAFDPTTGGSKLWLSAGGSVGHGGLWGVDIKEGTLGEDLTGRGWDVRVLNAEDARRQAADDRGERKREQEREQETELLKALDRLDPDAKGHGVTALRNQLGWNSDKVNRVVARLRGEGILEPCGVTVSIGSKASRDALGVRRKGGSND